jgi:hypothetical protein
MAQNFILASVGTVDLIDPSTGEIIVTSKTLTESGISFSVTAEDIRGGMANKLLGQYFHDSAMALNMTDALFNLQYLALNVGGTITVGGNAITTEQITTTVADKITVSETPQKFGNVGVLGWYSIAGENNWSKIDFDATTKTATVSGLASGTTVCVKYVKNDASAEQFIVSSAFIPSQCHAILTLPLFKAGTDSKTSFTSSSKVGEVQVEIPNFLLGGAQDLSLTASGASTTNLSGNALTTFDGTEGCDGDGYYARLIQITYNKDEFADVKSIVVSDSDIDLAVGEKQVLDVLAIYGGMTAPKKVEASKLTFTSSDDTVATVDTNGEVTAVAEGSAIVEVVVTDKSALVAKAVVTVTAE